ncbi:MAG: hypothetical protein Q8L88_15085 [Bacteroidota bacterium]|nr:hypothetical protein [Bacteroidota bacterium]
MRNKPVILQIGLTQYEPSWELLLRQIGVPWKVISPEEKLIESYSVIVVNNELNDSVDTLIEAFAGEGGTVLYTSLSVNSKHEKIKGTEFVSSLPPTQNVYYTTNGILDVYKKCFFFSNNDIVNIETSGNGFKAYLGIPCDIILSTDAQRKNFYTDSERMPNEIVARRTKGAFRQLIFALLVRLHQIQNIPFVHKWYYPDGAPTLFTFRVDSDKGTQEQIEEIFLLSDKYSIPTTWFLDVKSHENWISYFKKFTSQEITIHCYEHSISPDKEINFDNFSKAKSILKQSGIEATGFSAPTGIWNESLASTIEELGFQYSSEFGYDYDNLPSFSFYSKHFSKIPQLPIHPICIGSMLRAHMSNDEMIAYYKRIIDTNFALKEPICLYHHPTHRHNEVFEEIFNYIQKKNIVTLSYSEYAAWWKKRDEEISRWQYDNNGLTALGELSNNTYTRVILPDGSETIAVLGKIIDLEQLIFKPSTAKLQFSNDILRSRKFDIRHILQNALDWWIKITE